MRRTDVQTESRVIRALYYLSYFEDGYHQYKILEHCEIVASLSLVLVGESLMSRNSFVLLSFGMGNTLRVRYVTIFSCPVHTRKHQIVLRYRYQVRSSLELLNSLS